LPKRFAEILTEFKEAVSKQKQTERSETEQEQAKEKINQIYLEIKELIQEEIEQEESLEIEFEPGASEAEQKEQKQELEEFEKEKQERIKNLKLGLKKTTLSQFQRFNEEHCQSKEIKRLLTE
jgi:hypothetical protein